MAKYIVEGTLNHDGVTYKHGAEFETDDEKLVKELRATGAVKLPSELQSAADVQSELDRLRAKVAELEAAQQSQQTAEADASDGDAPKSDETSEGEEQQA